MSVIGVDRNAVLNGVSQATSAARTMAAAGTITAATGNAKQGNAITSKDFMTLLVTEMKNQDPTQPTDPNAYIQQLVGVNSLQQLIAINTELATTASHNANPVSGA